MSQEQTKREQTTENSISDADFRGLWQGLTHNQKRFAVAMLGATTKKDAALAIGIEPDTVYRWNGEIDQAVEYMQGQAKDAAIEIITNNTVKAAMVKVAGLDSYDEKQRQDAASEVLDRSLGRPTQRQEHTGADGVALVVNFTSNIDDAKL